MNHLQGTSIHNALRSTIIARSADLSNTICVKKDEASLCIDGLFGLGLRIPYSFPAKILVYSNIKLEFPYFNA